MMNNQNESNQEPKKLEISQEDLEALIAKASRVDDLSKSIERLESAVSKKKLHDFDSQNDPDEQRISIGYILDKDGNKKVITGWGNMLQNDCKKNIHGGWEEKQTMELYLGKEKMKVTQVERNELLKISPKLVVEGKRESKELNPHGNKSVFYTVNFEGKEYEIESTFINPT